MVKEEYDLMMYNIVEGWVNGHVFDIYERVSLGQISLELNIRSNLLVLIRDKHDYLAKNKIDYKKDCNCDFVFDIITSLNNKVIITHKDFYLSILVQ